jgi:MYXO-CTERM domain-containing protein
MSKSVFRAVALTAGGMLLAASAQAVVINIQSATGTAGQTVTVGVNLSTEGAEVAGTQNDIGFAAPIGVAARANGRPDCTVNGDISKGGTSFAFQPPGCTAGTDCTGVRALVLALDNVDPIPSGSVMYTCQVEVDSEAPNGDYPLTCTNPGASDPNGGALLAECTSGTVTVAGLEIPTETPTETPEVGTPTNTPAPTSTNTIAPPPTNTRAPGGGNDDDGCAVVAPAQASTGWLLLLPAAALLWLRRRSR